MGFVKKVGAYSIGNLLSLLAGLISFPIFTHMLPPAEYGLMSLINLTSILCIPFCKGGLQQALVREWTLSKAESCRITSTALYGSLILTITVFSILGAITVVVTLITNKQIYLTGFLIVFCLTVTETIRSIVQNKFRAMNEILKYNVQSVFVKYAQIALAIVAMTILGSTAFNLLLGMIIASLLSIAWIIFTESEYLNFSNFDFSKFKRMLLFGFPLISYEVTNQLLTFADRYFISNFNGADAVGKYSAAYNLTFYVQNLLITSISIAIFPMVVEKMNRNGYEDCKTFIKESLLWFCLVGSAITLGFAAIGDDIFILTASAKYMEAAVVISPVIIGGFMFGVFTVSSSNLFVQKNTKTMAMIMGTAAIFNILLDIMLIPNYGLLGAAYATLIPEIFLAVMGLLNLGYFKDTTNTMRMLHYCLPSLIMYLLLSVIRGETTWSSVLMRIIIGIVAWLLLVILFNRSGREEIFKMVKP